MKRRLDEAAAVSEMGCYSWLLDRSSPTPHCIRRTLICRRVRASQERNSF